MVNIQRLLMMAALLVLAGQASAEIDRNVVTSAGEIGGSKASSERHVIAFLGIPYAEPPIGENRWRAPQPLAPFEKRFKADTLGNRCMQAQSPGGVGRGGFGGRGFGDAGSPAGTGTFAGQARGGFGGGGGGFGGGGGGFGGRGFGGGGFGPQPEISEDCLTLNVWSGAESADAKAPVMVFIHGDELLRGAASEARYDGQVLASRGIVVVNFNYRLGAFGFLAHPALSEESGASGNYGLMDAIAALEWVRDNIAAFGGDPASVTVFGNSNGAVMTAALMGSPAAKGLFDRAILESGGPMGFRLQRMPTLADAEQQGLADLERFNADSAAALRALPAEQLVGALPAPQIIVDGSVIPEDLSAVFARGRQDGVDVIVGSNREDGVYFQERLDVRTAAEYEAAAHERYGDLAERFLALFPSGDDATAVASSVTALSEELAWQMRLVAAAQVATGHAAYVYNFTRVPPVGFGQQSRGATHRTEIPYVFDTPSPTWSDGDRRLAEVMASYWINFAETGSPNGLDRWENVELPDWPAYSGVENFDVMEFGDRVGVGASWQVPTQRLAFFDEVFSALVR